MRSGEYQFAGLLRGARTELVKCVGSELQVPARAEIVLEGAIHPDDTALEGPFGDHTGYYNEAERFPVLTIERITMRREPIYHSTYTGKPPDEPAMLGVALNEVFVPLLAKQFPEIVDFYLPPEGCSYRLAVVSMKKQYPGHAKRVMFGIWSFLRQFMYTKFIVVCDDDVDVRDWKEVVWAITTRVDPARDTLDRRAHADRLPGFRQSGGGARLQDGHRRDQQVARRNEQDLGPPDRDGCGGARQGRRDVARARALARSLAAPPDQQAEQQTDAARHSRGLPRVLVREAVGRDRGGLGPVDHRPLGFRYPRLGAANALFELRAQALHALARVRGGRAQQIFGVRQHDFDIGDELFTADGFVVHGCSLAGRFLDSRQLG